MAQKETLIDALINDSLPEGFTDLVIPSLESVGPGSDLESSAIEISKYCANMNKFLELFVGVKFGDYLLRGMQRSPGLVSLVLSSLGRNMGTGYIRVASPGDSTEWAGFAPLSVYGSEEITEVLCNSSAWGEQSLSQAEGIWTLKLILPADNYNLEFKGIHSEGETPTISRSVAVSDFTVYPPDAGTLIPETAYCEILTGSATDTIMAASVKIDAEDPIPLAKGVGEWKTAEEIEFGEGNHTAKWSVEVPYGEVVWQTTFDCPA